MRFQTTSAPSTRTSSPGFGEPKNSLIRRRDIVDLVEDIADGGAPVTAKRTLAAKWWIIPPTRTKHGLAHRVPLSSLALDLMEHVKALSGDTP
jgi:hypothetical protein